MQGIPNDAEDSDGEPPRAPNPDRSYERLSAEIPLLEHEHEFWIHDVTKHQEGDKVRSEPFVVGNFRYRVLVFPFGTKNNGTRAPPTLAAFVEADPLQVIDQERWMFPGVRYALTLINQHDYSESVHKTDTWSFCKRDQDRGWHHFVTCKELVDPLKGWINNVEERSICFRVQCYVRNSETLVNIGADYDSKRETGYIGLKNHGATCYLNCLLQTLFHIGKFRKLVYEADTSEAAESSAASSAQSGDKKAAVASSSSSSSQGGPGGGQPPNLLKSLQNSFYALQTQPQAGNCRELMRSFGWESVDAFTQHDYQELNRILLDKVEERLKDSRLDGEIKKLFAGEQESYIECTEVEYASKRLEPFYDINLNLKTDDGSWVNNLEDAFRDYVKEEIMEGDNAYDASDGGFGKQRAKKGIRFKSLPIVFNLLLKRFIFDLETLDTIKTNEEMRFPRRIDLSDYVPGDTPAVYSLYGVTVQTGTVSSGHYYCFLRPWIEEEAGKEAGLLHWVRFDDEQITKVTEYAAMQDNYGGQDYSIHNHLVHSIEELKAKQYHKKANWPATQQRISNAYILVYIREDQLEEVLKPPQPSLALEERIRKEHEQKAKARHEEQTRVVVSCVLERDLLEKQPCGFWDTAENSYTLTLPPFDVPKEEQAAAFWRKTVEHLKLIQEKNDKCGFDVETTGFKPEHLALFVLKRRTNRQIRFSYINHQQNIKDVQTGTEGAADQQATRMFGGQREQQYDSNIPRVTVLAQAASGYNPHTFQYDAEHWASTTTCALPNLDKFFQWKEDSLCLLLVKYFCPVTKNIMMLGVVYGRYQDKVKTLLPWVEKRQLTVADQYPELCRPVTPGSNWICFEEFSTSEVKPVEMEDSMKTADLYTGDILILQPAVDPATVPQTDDIPCNTAAELAANIQNRMTLRINLHEASEHWAIDGITADASVWNTKPVAGQVGDADTPNEESCTTSDLEASKQKSHEFIVDTRQTVSSCLSKIGAHFGIEQPHESLWIFRNPPSGNHEEPVSPQPKKTEEAVTLKDLNLPRQITLHAVHVPDVPKTLWRKQLHHLIEDHALTLKEQPISLDGKSLTLVVRYFDKHVTEQGMTILSGLPYDTDVKSTIKAACAKLFGPKVEGDPDALAKRFRLVWVQPNGKGLEILSPEALLRNMDFLRKGNLLYHCLRLESNEEAEREPDGSGEMRLITCYHAERGNATIPFGHPFFLPIYTSDTVPAIKRRVRDKLNVPEREFKQWRLGKQTELNHTSSHHSSMFDNGSTRNLLRDEDSNQELRNFFFSEKNAAGAGGGDNGNAQDGGGGAANRQGPQRTGGNTKICLEHTHPPPSVNLFGDLQKLRSKARGQLTIK